MGHASGLPGGAAGTYSAPLLRVAAALIIRERTITTAPTGPVFIAVITGADVPTTATITLTGTTRRFTAGRITRGLRPYIGASEHGDGAARPGTGITELIGIHIRCILRPHS